MVPKSFALGAFLAASLIVSSAVPAHLASTARQADGGFIFAVATDDQPAFVSTVPAPAPAPEEETPSAATPTPAAEETPAAATPTPDSGDAPEMTMDDAPAVTDEPTAGAETPATPMEPAVAAPAGGEGEVLAYNVGGPAVGDKWAADPEDWVIGETAAFEIPTAVIANAGPEDEDVYKSHRYGLLGSTWGYDIAVTTAGVYECTLFYAETYSEFFTEEPNRTFQVTISGDSDEAEQADEFDVMVELGGQEFTAYNRTYSNIKAVNTIQIRETPVSGDAFLSGILCSYFSPLALP